MFHFPWQMWKLHYQYRTISSFWSSHYPILCRPHKLKTLHSTELNIMGLLNIGRPCTWKPTVTKNSPKPEHRRCSVNKPKLSEDVQWVYGIIDFPFQVGEKVSHHAMSFRSDWLSFMWNNSALARWYSCLQPLSQMKAFVLKITVLKSYCFIHFFRPDQNCRQHINSSNLSFGSLISWAMV